MSRGDGQGGALPGCGGIGELKAIEEGLLAAQVFDAAGVDALDQREQKGGVGKNRGLDDVEGLGGGGGVGGGAGAVEGGTKLRVDEQGGVGEFALAGGVEPFVADKACAEAQRGVVV